MAKKKKRNDQRLRVIAGGGAPKAVVSKPARTSEPTNVRRNTSSVAKLPPVEEAAYDRVSAVEATPERAVPAAPFPRWIVVTGVAAVVAVAAWVLLGRGSGTTPTAVQKAPEVPVTTVPVAVTESAPAAVASAPAPANASAIATPSASAIASAPASASAPAPATATASASVAPAPKPKPAAPKVAPPSDDPYQ